MRGRGVAAPLPLISAKRKHSIMSITTSKLEAKLRTGAGKGPARRTRQGGLVPACVYGKHLEKPLNIALDGKALRAAINTPKKMNTVLGLSIEGKEHMVLLKDYQLEPVSRELLHADFIDVRENEQVKVKIPVVLTGKSVGVLEGGILSQMRRELEVWALPGAIPLNIEVDITPMKIASALHVNDIKMPAGITVKTNVNFTIAVVTAPEVEKAAEVAAAAATPAAGAAAPAAAAGDKKAEPAKADAAKAPAKK